MALAFDRGATFLQVASLAALRCRSLHRYPQAPIRTHVERYWRASKSRHEEWHSLLATIRRRYEEDRLDPLARNNHAFTGLVEEIFASDVLVRIWSAVVPQIGKSACPELTEFLHSALMGQMEVQSRLLRLLLDLPRGNGSCPWNKIRSATERWIDLLLGYLKPVCQIDSLACNLHRANDFAATFGETSLERQRATEILLAEGISASANRLFQSRCPHLRLNRRIVHSVLACLGPDLLDAVGPMARVWQSRLLHAAVEMKYWLDKLEVEDCVR